MADDLPVAPRVTVTRDDLSSPGGLIALLTAAGEALGMRDPTVWEAVYAEATYQLAAGLLAALEIREAGDHQ